MDGFLVAAAVVIGGVAVLWAAFTGGQEWERRDEAKRVARMFRPPDPPPQNASSASPPPWLEVSSSLTAGEVVVVLREHENGAVPMNATIMMCRWTPEAARGVAQHLIQAANNINQESK